MIVKDSRIIKPMRIAFTFICYLACWTIASGQAAWQRSPETFHGKSIVVEIGDIERLETVPPGLPDKEGFTVYRYSLANHDLRERFEKAFKETGDVDFDDVSPRPVEFIYVSDTRRDDFEAKYRLAPSEASDFSADLGYIAAPVQVGKKQRPAVGKNATGLLWQLGDHWVIIIN